MDSFHVVFLYFYCMTVVASHVLPPTNVTLHCRNFHNVLKWSYPENTSGLFFKLEIFSFQTAFDNPVWNTTALQANLSLPDPKDGYLITVSAVVNGSESEPAPSADGITFSYFQNSQVQTKCYLDLPPVNVTAHRDNNIQISFLNPLFFHCQKMKKNKHKCYKDLMTSTPYIQFKMKILNQTHSFMCEDQMCIKAVPVDAAQQKHCVDITGEASGILVKPKQLYCTEPFYEPSRSNFTTVYIVIAVLAVATVGLIVFMGYQKFTRPTNFLVKSLIIPKPSSLTTNTPESVAVDHVECPKRCDEVEPSSPTPLLTQTEEEDRTGLTDYDFRLPIGVSENSDMSNIIREGQPNGEGPGYMVGSTDFAEDNSGSGDENPGSGYEKRDTVLVELGPDESAKGYRGPVTHE